MDMQPYSVTIKKINWIDQEILEAEVLAEVNGKEFWAFSHPCKFQSSIEKAYFSFLEEEISDSVFWEENKTQLKEIIPAKSKLRYYCYGQLKSINPMLVDCGAITFSLGDWINDERVIDSYVYFVISRLDINQSI